MKNQSNTNGLEDLNNILFDTMRGYIANKVEKEKAQTVANLGTTIINNAKAQLSFYRQAGLNPPHIFNPVNTSQFPQIEAETMADEPEKIREIEVKDHKVVGHQLSGSTDQPENKSPSVQQKEFPAKEVVIDTGDCTPEEILAYIKHKKYLNVAEGITVESRLKFIENVKSHLEKK